MAYQWSTTTAGVVINNANAASTTFVAPVSITTATDVPFTLTVSSGSGASAVTSSANVTFLVDPFAPFTLAVTPPSQSISLSAAVPVPAVTIAASASTTNGTPTLYYLWTQQTSPNPVSVNIGGAETATMGFVPSVVGTYVFNVAVGYQPICPSVGFIPPGQTSSVCTAVYPGIYFGSATVSVQH